MTTAAVATLVRALLGRGPEDPTNRWLVVGTFGPRAPRCHLGAL